MKIVYGTSVPLDGVVVVAAQPDRLFDLYVHLAFGGLLVQVWRRTVLMPYLTKHTNENNWVSR